ncbi:MAG: phenylacetate--CoA ligase family protein [Armatimonadota bacterium]
MNIWDQTIETMDRDELGQLQLERLQATIFRAYRSVAFYRKRFDELGLVPEDIQSLEDLRRLPLTTTEDLYQGYPYDMLAVPLREVVRLHNASWRSGKPTVCAFTRNDLRHWDDTVARMLTAGDVTRDDVVQIVFGAAKLTSSLSCYGGAELIGASVIPVSPDGFDQQLAIMQDFKTTVLVGLPSDAAHFAVALQEKGLDVRRLSLRIGLFGSEPWSESLRAQVESLLGITALDYYDLAVAGGPGVAGECLHKCGLHLAEDQFIAEIVDPRTGLPLPQGEKGELVLTSLTKEALPLLRFRTRDITRLDTSPCACGRQTARMARVQARSDTMLFVHGINFYPQQIEDVLAEIEHAQPRYQIILDRKAGQEAIEIFIEVLPALVADSPGKLLTIEAQIIERVRQRTGLTVKVRLVEPLTFAHLVGEDAARVVDRREESLLAAP